MIKGAINNFIQSVNDVTASRALTTTYTNNSGRTLYVIVTMQHSITVANGSAFVTGVVVGISAVISGILQGAAGHQTYQECVFFVPPGATYRVNTQVVNGTNTMTSWIEAY